MRETPLLGTSGRGRNPGRLHWRTTIFRSP